MFSGFLDLLNFLLGVSDFLFGNSKHVVEEILSRDAAHA